MSLTQIVPINGLSRYLFPTPDESVIEAVLKAVVEAVGTRYTIRHPLGSQSTIVVMDCLIAVHSR